jgi:hypothetical protein
MARDLKHEVAIAAFIKQFAGRELANGQPAQYERARAETQSLVSLLALAPNQFDRLRFANLALGDPEIPKGLLQYGASRLKSPIDSWLG